MTKLEMREYLAGLETRIDVALKKWKKIARMEDVGVAQLEWQFEHARVILEVFWLDDETAELECKAPRLHWNHTWKGLNERTSSLIMDRIGNFAQIVMGRQNGRATR